MAMTSVLLPLGLDGHAFSGDVTVIYTSHLIGNVVEDYSLLTWCEGLLSDVAKVV